MRALLVVVLVVCSGCASFKNPPVAVPLDGGGRLMGPPCCRCFDADVPPPAGSTYTLPPCTLAI